MEVVLRRRDQKLAFFSDLSSIISSYTEGKLETARLPLKSGFEIMMAVVKSNFVTGCRYQNKDYGPACQRLE
jgi:hypothetical protein